jgi:hypothetical protein
MLLSAIPYDAFSPRALSYHINMSVALNVLLFLVSGTFSVTFFSQAHFYGFGETLVSRPTLLYALGGVVLLLGGLTRAIDPEIRP